MDYYEKSQVEAVESAQQEAISKSTSLAECPYDILVGLKL